MITDQSHYNSFKKGSTASQDLSLDAIAGDRVRRTLEDVADVLAHRPKLDESYLTDWAASFREVVSGDLVAECLCLRCSQGTPQ